MTAGEFIEAVNGMMGEVRKGNVEIVDAAFYLGCWWERMDSRDDAAASDYDRATDLRYECMTELYGASRAGARMAC